MESPEFSKMKQQLAKLNSKLGNEEIIKEALIKKMFSKRTSMIRKASVIELFILIPLMIGLYSVTKSSYQSSPLCLVLTTVLFFDVICDLILSHPWPKELSTLSVREIRDMHKRNFKKWVRIQILEFFVISPPLLTVLLSSPVLKPYLDINPVILAVLIVALATTVAFLMARAKKRALDDLGDFDS